MTQVNDQFSRVSVGCPVTVNHGDTVLYSTASAGTYGASLVLRRSADMHVWETVCTANAPESSSLVASHPGGGVMAYQWTCTSFSGDAVAASIHVQGA